MELLLRLVNGVFRFLFLPFRSVSPFYPLLFFSFFTGTLMVLAFRYASDQAAIRRAKDRIEAHLLAVRLFQDHIGVVLRSYARMVQAALAYLRYSLAPLALMVIPFGLIFSQLQMRLGWASPRPQERFLLTARVVPNAVLDDVSLHLPKELRLLAPSVRIPARGEISWRIEAEQYGVFSARVAAAGESFSKQITIRSDLAPLPIARVRSSIRQAVLYPGEVPLPRAGPLEAIELKYPPAPGFEVAGYRMGWWVLFFVFSFMFALVIKPLMRTEF